MVDQNLGPEAKSVENESSDTSNSRSDSRFSEFDFDWGETEVISEPIVGQNINVEHSGITSVTFENDKIYVTWMDKNDTNGAGTDYDIFFKYFNGNKWSEVQVISEPINGQNFNTADCFVPRIAVENGKIYVVWCDDNNTNGAGVDDDILFRCNITGNKWEDIQVISEPTRGENVNIGQSLDPDIVVENGKIYVVWKDDNDTNGASSDWDIHYRCNLSGSSWDPIQVISEPIAGYNFKGEGSVYPAIAVENGKIYVAWHDSNNTNQAGSDSDIFLRCNFTGSYWEPEQVISEPVANENLNIRSSTAPSIAVEDGNIYIVWSDVNDTNNAGTDDDIFYRCNLSEFGWGEIQVISEPIPGHDFNIQQSMSPSISVENGQIYVVWHDRNDTYNAGGIEDIFFKCNVTSSYWEPVQIISEPMAGYDINTEYSEFPDIVVNLGKNHIVWRDQNNTNGASTDRDTFYRNISLSLILGKPTVTPTFGNTSTKFNFTVTCFQYDNIPPTEISVNIDDIEHSMSEVDNTDTNLLDGKKYFFNIKNLDIKTHTYQFFASDDIHTFLTRLVSKPIVYNTPPRIISQDNITAYENIPYEVDYEYEDIDSANVGQLGAWQCTTDVDWLSFDPITAILNGTPSNDDAGEFWVNITIDDSMDIDFTNFTLTVVGINDDPAINTTDQVIAYEDELYEVDYEALDGDSVIQNQYWTLNTNATSWLSMDSDTGILRGTPTNDDIGDYWVNISVHDGDGGLGFTNFTLKVLNVNDQPIITTEDIPLASVGILYEVDYNATDIDSPISNFEWSLVSNASWLAIEPSTGVLNGTPTDLDTGQFHVNVTVHDGDNGFDWHDFSIGVASVPINVPPIITTNDILSAIVSELYYLDYEAVDDRTPVNELSWDIQTNASWLTIEKNTGVLKGTPTVNDIGQYWVNLSVYDGEGGKTYHNFTITVYLSHDFVPIPNTAPTLFESLLSPQAGRIYTEFTFSIRYFDLDGDPPAFIQIVLDGSKYNMTFKIGNTSNGLYEFKTKLSQGEHIYHFTASDGEYTVNTENFTTPYIEKESDVSTGKMSNWLWLLSIIIFIVVIATFFMIIRKKQQKQETLIPEPITLRPSLRPTPPITAGYTSSEPVPTQKPMPTTIEVPLTTQQPTTTLSPQIPTSQLPQQGAQDNLMLPPSQTDLPPIQQPPSLQDSYQTQSQQQQQSQPQLAQQPQTLQQNQQVPDQQPPLVKETKLEDWDIQK